MHRCPSAQPGSFLRCACAAVNDGADEEEVVAAQLGAQGAADLSDVQSQYKDKIREKLAEVGERLS